MSETWPTDCTAELLNITGYNFVLNHRKSETGMILNDLSDHLPVFAYFDDATLNAQHRKENYDENSMTIICINSTRIFQTQNGPHFATWKVQMKLIMILLKSTLESTTPVSL